MGHIDPKRTFFSQDNTNPPLFCSYYTTVSLILESHAYMTVHQSLESGPGKVYPKSTLPDDESVWWEQLQHPLYPKKGLPKVPLEKNLGENISLWADLKEKSSFFFLEQVYPGHKMTVMQMVDNEELTYRWVFPLQQGKKGVMTHIWLERVMLVRH